MTGELSKRAACQEYGLNWRTLEKMLFHVEPPGYRRQEKREQPVLGLHLKLVHVPPTDITAYERQSLIVTTNLPFERWTEVLGSERLTGAALDRLTHRCHILEAKGESFRLRDARRRQRLASGPSSQVPTKKTELHGGDRTVRC